VDSLLLSYFFHKRPFFVKFFQAPSIVFFDGDWFVKLILLTKLRCILVGLQSTGRMQGGAIFPEKN